VVVFSNSEQHKQAVMVYKFSGEGKTKLSHPSFAPHKLHSGAVRGLKEMLR
jgi:hypothetical protein